MDDRPPSASPRLAAAFVAAALAAVALGVLALLRYDNAGIDEWLTWRPAAEMIGPGVIALGVGVVAWLVMYPLHWPRRISGAVVLLVLALVVLALVLAFPPFDQLVS